ncbi:MAG TPA: transcription antitermination factor NusB [Fimbriimonas sp.]|nr:transcription antitermination factor NusB [Fimbriimonas sp.]
MAAKSKRKAREAALRALYEIEVGGTDLDTAIEDAQEAAHLSQEMAAYAQRVVRGTIKHQQELDPALSDIVIDYDFNRLAAVDRNVLRIAAFELRFEPSVPAAVSIDEAIEISRKFSTVESGKFVNGVLGKFLERFPKHYVEQPEPEQPDEPEAVEVVTEVVSEDSPEAATARKFGTWTIRNE